MISDVAILLPSYRRKKDLENVLNKTHSDRAKFIVVANYPKEEYKELISKYGSKAIFIDETKYGKLGVCGAYNLAFDKARKSNFKYCVLFADDVLPQKKSWLNNAIDILEKSSAALGIFSSDEGHFGSFGWNIIKETPIGHFFVARTLDLDKFFDPKYKQYVIDLEIVARVLKLNKKVILLPVRVNHFRSPLNRESYGQNYKKDLETFLNDYPEYKPWIGNNKELFIPEQKSAIQIEKGGKLPISYSWPMHKQKPSIGSFAKKLLGDKNEK